MIAAGAQRHGHAAVQRAADLGPVGAGGGITLAVGLHGIVARDLRRAQAVLGEMLERIAQQHIAPDRRVIVRRPADQPRVPGGPGQGAADFYAGYAPAFAEIARTRDIVLVDQRGTGRSAPLSCEDPPPTAPLSELSEGRFHRMIDDAEVEPAAVRRVLLCSGKIYYELVAARQARGRDDVAIVRIEQLFPFPADELRAALSRYAGAREVLWVQEEPRNMGAWSFVRPRLEAVLGGSVAGPRFVGRPASASPATGSSESHKFEQDQIMQEAFAGL